MDETNFKLGDLKVRLGQFSTRVDSRNVSVGKIIKILGGLGKKSQNQTLLISGMFNLSKLLLVMSAINAPAMIFSNETSFSGTTQLVIG